MNKIAMFGATGMTGLCALDAAIKQGLKVTLLVRDVLRLPDSYKNDSNVNVIVGDVTKLEDVQKTVDGQDGVVVTLGTRNDLGATTVMSDGIQNIIAAMKDSSVKTISVCLSAFLFYEPEKVPAIFQALNADHQRMYDLLKVSDLNWIAVFPPHIADAPRSEFITKHGASPGPRVISKYDLGAFLVESLDQPEHYQKVVGIANISN
ncbi:flavin reductase (NADPH) [Lycorma delicatula]|uniref:flavin reductase (NADPH) n=1 Tax=Lycorma delicatula TaxID=130591 RepID=UPI003F5187EB